MYLVYTRTELVFKKAGINQKFKVETIPDAFAVVVAMQRQHNMYMAEYDRSDNDGILYARLQNKHFTIWYYATRWENGKDLLLDKILKRIGMV